MQYFDVNSDDMYSLDDIINEELAEDEEMWED
jgi:hypothetical protein